MFTWQPFRLSLLVLVSAGIAGLLITSCSESEESVHPALVEAVQLFEQARAAERTSFVTAAQLYRAALHKARSVHPAPPSARRSIRRAADPVLIGPYTLGALQNAIIPSVTAKAEAERSSLACALFLAQRLPETVHKAQILEQIGLAYLELGQDDRAAQATQLIGDSPHGANMLERLARRAIRAGRSEQALRFARQIVTTHALFGVELLTELALQHVRRGQHADALKVAQGAGRASSSAWVMAEIAGTLTDPGQQATALSMLDQAVQLAQRVPHPPLKSLVLGQIGHAYVRLGHSDRALQTALNLKDSRHRTNLLVAITQAAVEAGEPERVSGLIQKLQASHERPFLIAQALTEIAEKQLEFGLAERARDVLSTAQHVAAAIDEQAQRARIIGRIALGYLEAGRPDTAHALVDAIRDPVQRLDARVRLALGQVEAGDLEAARQAAQTMTDQIRRAEIEESIVLSYLNRGELQQARQLAQAIQAPGQRAEALGHVAHSYLEFGQIAPALHLAELLTDQPQRDEVVGRVVRAYLDEDAGQQALRQARTIQDPRLKAQALSRIARSHARAGAFAAALQIAESMTDQARQAEVVAQIGLEYFRAGQTDRGVSLIRSLQDSQPRASALGQLARSYAQAGESQVAVQLVMAIRLPDRREATLQMVAEVHHQAGRHDQAVGVIRRMQAAPEKAELLAKIAAAYTKQGAQEKSASLTVQALSIAKTRTNPAAQAHTLAAVGLWQAKAEQRLETQAQAILHDMIAEAALR
jgi:tetratricopeptide (TPR) repeat protein